MSMMISNQTFYKPKTNYFEKNRILVTEYADQMFFMRKYRP